CIVIFPYVDPSAVSGRGCFLDLASAGICHNQCWHCADDAGCLACRYSSSRCVIFVPDRADGFASFFWCSLGSLGRCRCIRPRRTKTFLSDRDSALRSWHNRDVAGECAALHSSRRHDHAPVADSGRNHKLLVQSFAPHFVRDLLHRDSLLCEYILRFGRIDSGRTRVLVAISSFAPTISENTSGVVLGSVGGIATACMSIYQCIKGAFLNAKQWRKARFCMKMHNF